MNETKLIPGDIVLRTHPLLAHEQLAIVHYVEDGTPIITTMFPHTRQILAATADADLYKVGRIKLGDWVYVKWIGSPGSLVGEVVSVGPGGCTVKAADGVAQEIGFAAIRAFGSNVDCVRAQEADHTPPMVDAYNGRRVHLTTGGSVNLAWNLAPIIGDTKVGRKFASPNEDQNHIAAPVNGDLRLSNLIDGKTPTACHAAWHENRRAVENGLPPPVTLTAAQIAAAKAVCARVEDLERSTRKV